MHEGHRLLPMSKDVPTNILIKSCALALARNSQGFASKMFAIENEDSFGKK